MSIRRLMRKYPFHAQILERFRLVSRPEVGTMGVTVSGDAILLLHNPSFVLSTPADQLIGVLVHETHHVLFRHILSDPADYPDRWARTVAEEVTANEFVKEPLPEGAIKLEQFPDLPPMESTDRRYERLRGKDPRPEIRTPQGQITTSEAAGVPNHKAEGETQKRPDSEQGQEAATVDDHSVWQEAWEDAERSETAIEDVIRGAVHEVGPDHVPDELKNLLDDELIGKEPGRQTHILHGSLRGQLNWRHLLRRYVGQAREVRPVFNRPSRRFPELVGIVPGRARRTGLPKIMAVIDTSGSITDALLEKIDAELALLAKHHTVTVVQCDSEIHAVNEYRPLDVIAGRGGTDFRPAFAQEFLRKHRPDLIVYFTDGRGPAPKRPPRVPVIWCLTPGGWLPVDWGRVIHM